MGIIVGAVDWSQRISPVVPMPTPDYNLLFAIQTLASGKLSSTASSTITRSAGLAINDIASTMPGLSSLVTLAYNAYRNMSADTDKFVFSRLSNLLINIGLNKVNCSKL